MDIGKYKAVTKPITIAFEGEVLNLQVRTHIYTLGLQRKLKTAQENEDAAGLASFFLEIIAAWDLHDGDHVVPLTTEGLEGVPLEILGAIDRGIGDALLPTEEEKKGSSEPSASPPTTSTEPSTSSPESGLTSSNGLATSESPTASESVPST